MLKKIMFLAMLFTALFLMAGCDFGNKTEVAEDFIGTWIDVDFSSKRLEIYDDETYELYENDIVDEEGTWELEDDDEIILYRPPILLFAQETVAKMGTESYQPQKGGSWYSKTYLVWEGDKYYKKETGN